MSVLPFHRPLALLAQAGVFTGTVFASGAAFAQAAAAPDKADISWMLISTVLVLLMTIPGLALFYGGLVRAKNILSVLAQVFAIVALVSVIWVTYGYSLTFTDGGAYNQFIGGFSKAFLTGVTSTSTVETFSRGVVIPEYVYITFQMTFACITPALIIGAFAERIRFSAVFLFVILWVTFVYFPVAHMVWWWAGPEFAATNSADKTAAAAGLIASWGALDFAGGTVVHINAGIAGLVGCLMLGKRLGYGKDLIAPHSLTMTMIGACLLWVGWFGFNAGSALEANNTAGLAMINTFVSAAAAAIGWMFVEWAGKGKPSLLGMLSGAVAGLVAVTPAAGFAGPMGSLGLGFVSGAVCYLFCTSIKNSVGYDDSLDVFGIHFIGGVLGALGTGLLVNPMLGGTGVTDYAMNRGAGGIADYVMADQMIAQVKGVLVTVAWSGIGSAILFKLVDILIGLRVTQDEEREGLDLADHGERAYNY